MATSVSPFCTRCVLEPVADELEVSEERFDGDRLEGDKPLLDEDEDRLADPKLL